VKKTMKNISFTYLMIVGVSAAVAAFCFYLVYLGVNAQSQGAWLFAAFGLLFSVLPVSALIRILASRSDFFARVDKAVSPRPKEPQGVRFVPHWMMLIAMIVIALIVISVIINVIRGLLH
jgi:magnesium-transporting ATPase (P-type)